MRLKDKVAIVTGGASGFGEAFARRFASEGAAVVLVDVTRDAGEKIVAELTEAGTEAIFVPGDVSSSEDVAGAVRATRERFGRLDIVVNNAGITPPRAAVTDMLEADFDRVFAVNVRSIFLFTKHATPEMKAGGCFINVASTSALKPRALISGYSASKSAVITLTRSYAVELAPQQIRVNALAPVAADTPMFRGYLDGDEALLQRTKAAIPLGRLCDPTDMASSVVFLASDEASFLTGVCLPVDGGWTAG